MPEINRNRIAFMPGKPPRSSEPQNLRIAMSARVLGNANQLIAALNNAAKTSEIQKIVLRVVALDGKKHAKP